MRISAWAKSAWMRQSRLSLAVGQGGAGDAPADAHVVELGVLGAQAGLDVAQALAIGQLREGHAQIPDRRQEQASQPAIAAVAVDAKLVHLMLCGTRQLGG